MSALVPAIDLHTASNIETDHRGVIEFILQIDTTHAILNFASGVEHETVIIECDRICYGACRIPRWPEQPSPTEGYLGRE